MIRKQLRFTGHLRSAMWRREKPDNVFTFLCQELMTPGHKDVEFEVRTQADTFDDISAKVGRLARIKVELDISESTQDTKDITAWTQECADEVAPEPEPKVIGLMPGT